MMYRYNGPVRRQGRGALGGCLVTIVILIIVGGVLGYVFLRARPNGGGLGGGTTLSVGPHPTIIGDSCSGDLIFVQAGAAGQVTITDSGTYEYTQDSTNNTIEFTSCNNGLRLTVPPESNLQISADDAMTVMGVSGVMKLSNNGSRVVLAQVTLEGASKIDNNGGPIIFSGNITPGSTPTLSCNSGSIDATLPASASFHLAFTGILGPLVSNIPGVQLPGQDTSSFSVDVGHNPGNTKLTLDLNDTSVLLNQTA